MYLLGAAVHACSKKANDVVIALLCGVTDAVYRVRRTAIRHLARSAGAFPNATKEMIKAFVEGRDALRTISTDDALQQLMELATAS